MLLMIKKHMHIKNTQTCTEPPSKHQTQYSNQHTFITRAHANVLERKTVCVYVCVHDHCPSSHDMNLQSNTLIISLASLNAEPAKRRTVEQRKRLTDGGNDKDGAASTVSLNCISHASRSLRAQTEHAQNRTHTAI